MPPKTEKKKIKCQGECKRELIETNFYQSNSPLFLSNGRVNICKSCLKKMIDYNDMNSIYTVLQALDIVFVYEYWDKCVGSNRDTFGAYVTQANSLPQLKGLRWKDSVFDSSKSVQVKKEENSEIEKEEKMIYSEDWRGTYTESDLHYLDNYYKDLTTDFKIVTRNHKDYARKIAKASLAMDRAYDDMINGTQGADTRYKNLKDTFDQLSKSAQFAEDKRGANEVGLGCFGVTFDKVEKRQWIPKHVPLEKDDYDKLLDSFSVIDKSL